MKRIYLDTNIWDQLCDQKVDPKQFTDALAVKDFTLVLSFHSVYEFGRIFTSTDPAVLARGRQLCAYIKEYLDLGMPCTKEFWELILSEAYAFENALPGIDPMATPEECALTRQKIEKLANGIVEDRVRPFLDKRLDFAKETRSDQKNHIDTRQQLKTNLKQVKEGDLAAWMQKETFTPEGVNTLYGKFIKRLGPGATPEYILHVLKYPAAVAARASVRADIYYNWHSAQYEGIRLDLLDDLLHMLQAVYCDLYLSEDKSQARYGPLILTSNTRIEIYRDRTIPIDQWIHSLL